MQPFAKFKKILRRGFRATLNFRKYDSSTLIYVCSNESGQNRLEWLKILEMLWSELRLVFKTSSVTPDLFYVFLSNLIIFYRQSKF